MERKIEVGEILMPMNGFTYEGKARPFKAASHYWESVVTSTRVGGVRLAELSDVLGSEEAVLFVDRYVMCGGQAVCLNGRIRFYANGEWAWGLDSGGFATSKDLTLLPLSYSPEKTPEERERIGATLPPLGTLKPSDVVPGMILGHRCEGCKWMSYGCREILGNETCKAGSAAHNFADTEVVKLFIANEEKKYSLCPLSQCYPVDAGKVASGGVVINRMAFVGSDGQGETIIPIKNGEAKVPMPKGTVTVNYKGIVPAWGNLLEKYFGKVESVPGTPEPGVVEVPEMRGKDGADGPNGEKGGKGGRMYIPQDWKCPHCGKVVAQGHHIFAYANSEYTGPWEGCEDCFAQALGIPRVVPPDVAARRERREWLESLTARPEPRRVEE